MPLCVPYRELRLYPTSNGYSVGYSQGNGTFSFTVLENLTDKNVGDILRRVSPGIVVSVKDLLE